VSSQAVGHPIFAAGHLSKRPHVVCANRAAGIVALSPFHETGIPFVAADIPPHCPIPPPATPRADFRSSPAALPQTMPENRCAIAQQLNNP